tara:strand:+ start:184 stop:735 length:552 start_codon:yes stop_codon:yes gene_type:complete
MAITIDKIQLSAIHKPDLTPVGTVTFTEGLGDTITNIQCSIENDPNVVITIDVSAKTITFSGEYLDPYRDIFYLVDRGKSTFEDEELKEVYKEVSRDLPNDKKVYMEPIVHQGMSNFPQGKSLYKLEQDRTPSYQKTFKAVVTYTRSSPTIVDIMQDFTITQEILNDSDAIQNFVENYVRANQ